MYDILRTKHFGTFWIITTSFPCDIRNFPPALRSQGAREMEYRTSRSTTASRCLYGHTVRSFWRWWHFPLFRWVFPMLLWAFCSIQPYHMQLNRVTTFHPEDLWQKLYYFEGGFAAVLCHAFSTKFLLMLPRCLPWASTQNIYRTLGNLKEKLGLKFL